MHKIFFLAVLALLPAKVLAGSENAEAFFEAAWNSVETVKGGSLDSSEVDQLKKNATREARKRFDEYLDPDDNASHFVKSVNEYWDDGELIEHLSICRVCNPIVKNLVSRTGIPPVPFINNRPYQRSIAQACITPFGTCPMAISIPVGSPCYCPTIQGPVWGQAQ